MTATIVTIIGVLAVTGTVALVVMSARLRDEIARLFRAFDRTDRALVPLVATVRTDRDRLAERLARLTDAGSDADASRR